MPQNHPHQNTLADHRKGSGLSQRTLAEAVGVHLRSIQDYESGKTMPGAFAAVRIASVLAVPIEELWPQAMDVPGEKVS